MGAPVLTMELAVGRASRKSIVQGYKALEPAGSKWHLHGWVCIIGCYLLMMYYTTVSGWMLNYFVKFAVGEFSNVDSEGVAAVFGDMLASPEQLVGYMVITVILGVLVCSIGIQNGVERVSKVMMVALMVLIVILAGHSLLLNGAGEGVKFYLLPDFSRAAEMGLGNVITAAMNQAFFTLSLGIASMEIFGTYISKDRTLGGEAVSIVALDTFVAIMAGLIIFPACFSYNVDAGAGPSLIFITLPQIFIHMAGGRVWGSLFFLFMTFASMSTVIAVFENLIAAGMDNFGLMILLVGSLPCALGYNVLANVHLIGGRDILDSEDFIVSNLLLPIGAMIYTLFCTMKYGWGFDKYIEEVNAGEGLKVPKGLRLYFTFGLPVLIIVILVQGLIG